MSHFDHMTLELNGVFDAQSRVAHRAYKIDLSAGKKRRFNLWHAIRTVICRSSSVRRTDEWRAYFTDKDFRKALRRASATQLADIVSRPPGQPVLALLTTLRNTIHGAGLHMVAYRCRAEPEKSYVQVPADYVGKLWIAAQNATSPAEWGLLQENEETWLEPYTCSVRLIEESFKLIDKICAATDLSGLFPDGQIPRVPGSMPFEESVKKRLAVLG